MTYIFMIQVFWVVLLIPRALKEYTGLCTMVKWF